MKTTLTYLLGLIFIAGMISCGPRGDEKAPGFLNTSNNARSQSISRDTNINKWTVNKELLHVASEINKTAPLMVNGDTRFDNCIATSGNVFQYNFTLINTAKINVDTNELRKINIPTWENYVRTNPGMKPFRDNMVTVKYYYKDKNGEYLFSYSITPEKYK
jgi:hypothetical protein